MILRSIDQVQLQHSNQPPRLSYLPPLPTASGTFSCLPQSTSRIDRVARPSVRHNSQTPFPFPILRALAILFLHYIITAPTTSTTLNPPPSLSIFFLPFPLHLRDSSTIPRSSSPCGGTARNEYYDRIPHRTARAQPAESGTQRGGFDRNVRNHGAQWTRGPTAELQEVSVILSPCMRVCAGRQCNCGRDGGSLESRRREEAIDRVFTPWQPRSVAPDLFCEGKAAFIDAC